ncbi:hypothetical protein MUK42_35000 [Musa troglodytarum]|uniref:Uncharacterized protein n=1 Tax=Musa troglodytarum TaxID=320322 RepID=A0A9E7H2K4_9LILI|nr:hypothetical protein MUK42_35000 [Musa troglodytarum]URE26340.1 hypothetical protein MUK42_35000 [Musa troglodytarum]
MLSSHVQLLCQWEPHTKRHFEAVATLGRFLGAVDPLLPLVEGVKIKASGERAHSVSMKSDLQSHGINKTKQPVYELVCTPCDSMISWNVL